MSSGAQVVVAAAAGAAAMALYNVLTYRTPRRAQPLTETEERLWQAEELIAQRRSIFPQSYDPSRVVPRDIIERMLESANWAPTHARTEPWRFVVFATPEARRRLGEKEAEIYKAMCPPSAFLPKKYAKKIESKQQASYVIAICMKRQPSEKLPEVEEVCAVACAVQNMHLVATAHGVGAYWSSGGPIFSDDMKAFLGLSEKDKCLGFFYVGYPQGGHPRGSRQDYRKKVTWVEE